MGVCQAVRYALTFSRRSEREICADLRGSSIIPAFASSSLYCRVTSEETNTASALQTWIIIILSSVHRMMWRKYCTELHRIRLRLSSCSNIFIWSSTGNERKCRVCAAAIVGFRSASGLQKNKKLDSEGQALGSTPKSACTYLVGSSMSRKSHLLLNCFNLFRPIHVARVRLLDGLALLVSSWLREPLTCISARAAG